MDLEKKIIFNFCCCFNTRKGLQKNKRNDSERNAFVRTMESFWSKNKELNNGQSHCFCSILNVYWLVLKIKSWEILFLKNLSSQELVLKVPKKKPSFGWAFLFIHVLSVTLCGGYDFNGTFLFYFLSFVVYFEHLLGRDSGNDFRVAKIGSDNGHFWFFFSFPRVVSSLFFKRMLVLGTDFHFVGYISAWL